MNAPPAGAIEGRLEIELTPAHHRVLIRSSRPVTAARVFEGKAVDETLRLLPLLYAVCGQAQRTAAVRAIESATALSASTTVESARDRLVTLETLREHLWRVLLDWPRLCGDEPASQQVPGMLALIGQVQRRIDPHDRLCRQPVPDFVPTANPADAWQTLADAIAGQIYGEPPGTWLQRDAAGIDRWLQSTQTPATRLLRAVRARGWEGIGGSACPALPVLRDTDLLQRLRADDADRFLAAPTLPGGPFETGTLIRQADQPLVEEVIGLHGRALYTRLLARLVEMARIVLYADGDPVRPATAGSGIAQLEAARGRLCHRVVVDGDHIARYQILAPTEWNFAPHGPAIEALLGVVEGDLPALRTQAELLIHSIDPCVGYTLAVESG